METIYEVTTWFQRRFRGECEAASSWRIVKLAFSWNPYASTEKGGIIEHVKPVMAKWCSSGVVQLLNFEPERGASCEHLDVLVTHLVAEPSGMSGTQNAGRDARCTQIRAWTLRPPSTWQNQGVIAEIMKATGVHERIITAMLKEMKGLQEVAGLGLCETQ